MMKLALVFCTALGLTAFAGSTSIHRETAVDAQQDTAISVPAWLALPDSEYVSSIEYSGEMGNESARGAVTLELPSDGESEMAWLLAHFQARGYQLEDRTSMLDQFGGVSAILSVGDAATGRRLTIVNSPSGDGATLRITFEDPHLETQV